MLVAVSTTQGAVEPKIDGGGDNGGRNGGRNRGGNWNGNSGGGRGGGIGNFGSGGSSNNNKPTEYKITKEAYEALLKKWGYIDGLIPGVPFQQENYTDELIIPFITENFEPLFEMKGEQLKDTIAVIFIKLQLAKKEKKPEDTPYKNALDALSVCAEITGSEIYYIEGKETFSIDKNRYKYHFLPDQALIDLEIKNILENNDTNAFYYQFYKFLAANLKEDDILTRLDYFCKSEPLKTKLPEFVTEIKQIKQRLEFLVGENYSSEDYSREDIEYVVFNSTERVNFPNVNSIFNREHFLKDIKEDVTKNTAQAFIEGIKNIAVDVNNKIISFSKDKNKGHLIRLHYNSLRSYYNVMNTLGLSFNVKEKKLNIMPEKQIPIFSDNILLGLDSEKLLDIFAEVLKINGTNTENIPKIVDYYLKILCSSFVRELVGDINETFTKFNGLPITQVPYLEDKIELIKKYIINVDEMDLSYYPAEKYLEELGDKLTEYKTFFQTNINASSTQLAKLLTDAIKEDDERIKANQEPTAFKETFEKIARLLFLKSCYKGQEIDVNSAEFKEKFEKFKPLPIAEILKNEYVQEYLSEIIKEIEKDEVRRWCLKKNIELVKSTKPQLGKKNGGVEDEEEWRLKLIKTIERMTPPSTLIKLHKALISDNGQEQQQPSSR